MWTWHEHSCRAIPKEGNRSVSARSSWTSFAKYASNWCGSKSTKHRHRAIRPDGLGLFEERFCGSTLHDDVTKPIVFHIFASGNVCALMGLCGPCLWPPFPVVATKLLLDSMNLCSSFSQCVTTFTHITKAQLTCTRDEECYKGHCHPITLQVQCPGVQVPWKRRHSLLSHRIGWCVYPIADDSIRCFSNCSATSFRCWRTRRTFLNFAVLCPTDTIQCDHAGKEHDPSLIITWYIELWPSTCQPQIPSWY